MVYPSSITCLPRKVADALSQPPHAQPYPRFAIEDVVATEEYRTLCDEFPDVLIDHEGSFGSFNIHPSDQIDSRLSRSWMQFLEALRSPSMKEQLVQVCYPHAVSRYPLWMQPMLRNRLRNPNNYEVNIAFNSSTEHRYLPPHSDNSYKVLALVFYVTRFTDESFGLGTHFFSPRNKTAVRDAVKRFNRLADSSLVRKLPLWLLPMTSCNIHNDSRNDRERHDADIWFQSNFCQDFTIGYKGNRMAGFIKSHGSFHAVDLRDVALDEPRRTLLINLNLKHSVYVRFGQSFRSRVLRKST